MTTMAWLLGIGLVVVVALIYLAGLVLAWALEPSASTREDPR